MVLKVKTSLYACVLSNLNKGYPGLYSVYFTGVLLFSVQDIVAFLLCRTDSSIHAGSGEPVLLWTAGTILCQL